MPTCRHAPKWSRILLLSLEYFGILHVSACLLDGIIIILTQFLCSKDYGILYINPNYPLIISQCRHGPKLSGILLVCLEYFGILHVSACLHVSINLCRVADVLVNALIYHVYKLELSMSTPMCRQLIFFTNFVPKTFKCYQFEIAHPPHIAFK